MSASVASILACMIFLLSQMAMATGRLETRIMTLPNHQTPDDNDPAWQIEAPHNISRGFTQDTLWIEASISGLAAVQDPILVIANPLLDEIKIHIRNSEGWVILYDIGDRYNYDQRVVDHRNFLIPLPTGQTEPVRLLLQIKTRDAMIVPLALEARDAYLSKDVALQDSIGAFFGGMLCLTIYIFTIFLLTKDLAYLFNGLFLIASALFHGAQSGKFFEWFWPHSPAWHNMSDPFSVALLLLTACLFTFQFLDIRQKLPRWRPAVHATLGLCATDLALCLFMPYETLILIIIATVFPVCVVSLGAAIKLALQKDENSYFYIFGWVPVMIGGILGIGVQTEVLPYHPLTLSGLMFGNLAQSLVFAFALARKINLAMKRERQAEQELSRERESHIKDLAAANESLRLAQANLIEKNNQIEAINKNLETIVDNRTGEIKSLLQNLKQGVFTIGENLQINEFYSQHTKQIIEVDDIAGRNVVNLLFDCSNLGDDRKSQIQTLILISINEDRFAFEANSHVLPNEIIYRTHGKEKMLQLDWEVILDKKLQGTGCHGRSEGCDRLEEGPIREQDEAAIH